MNHDQEYNRLLALVTNEGRVKKNRTGIDTIGVFGAQARFDLSQGFPLLTTKKVFHKGIVHELLWFLAGDTNIKYLVDNDVHIWDGNAFDLYQKKQESGLMITDPYKLTNQELEVFRGGNVGEMQSLVKTNMLMKQAAFINRIKDDREFANKYGDLGQGTYGGMWRDFPFYRDNEYIAGVPEVDYVDQIDKLIKNLRAKPDDRRMIVSAWHPYWVDHCALPPCHVLFHFNTEELTIDERLEVAGLEISQCILANAIDAHDKNEAILTDLDGYEIPKRRLNCLLYQRSCDLFLGVPFNIASYSLLIHLVAQVVGMVPGTFVHTYGDLHLYSNHLDQVREQLSREPYPSPVVKLKKEVKEITDFKFSDITFERYQSHPTIKAEMAI